MILNNTDLPSSVQKFLHLAPLPSLAWWAILGNENQNLDLQWLVAWARYWLGIVNRSGLNC
jgi:hypothetical protein